MCDDKQIIHSRCGLPAELCDCPDAEIVYDWDRDTWIMADVKPNKGHRMKPQLIKGAFKILQKGQ